MGRSDTRRGARVLGPHEGSRPGSGYLMNPFQQPLPEPVCPLCGAANECAVAASGDFATPCWCRGVTFTAELLATVPEGMKGRACICRACAEGAAKGENEAGMREDSPGKG